MDSVSQCKSEGIFDWQWKYNREVFMWICKSVGIIGWQWKRWRAIKPLSFRFLWHMGAIVLNHLRITDLSCISYFGRQSQTFVQTLWVERETVIIHFHDVRHRFPDFQQLTCEWAKYLPVNKDLLNPVH